MISVLNSSKFLLGGLLKTIKVKIEQYFPGRRAFFTSVTADLDRSVNVASTPLNLIEIDA